MSIFDGMFNNVELTSIFLRITQFVPGVQIAVAVLAIAIDGRTCQPNLTTDLAGYMGLALILIHILSACLLSSCSYSRACDNFLSIFVLVLDVACILSIITLSSLSLFKSDSWWQLTKFFHCFSL